VPRKRSSRALDKTTRVEAVLVAQELIYKRVANMAMIEAIRQQYGCGDKSARSVIDEAIRTIQQRMAVETPHRRAQMLAGLDRLYEMCLNERRFGDALGVQRLLAKIEGHEKPQKHVMVTVPADTDQEVDGRSEAELEYFIAKGRWPEDDNVELGNGEPGSGGAGDDFPLH